MATTSFINTLPSFNTQAERDLNPQEAALSTFARRYGMRVSVNHQERFCLEIPDDPLSNIEREQIIDIEIPASGFHRLQQLDDMQTKYREHQKIRAKLSQHRKRNAAAENAYQHYKTLLKLTGFEESIDIE